MPFSSQIRDLSNNSERRAAVAGLTAPIANVKPRLATLSHGHDEPDFKKRAYDEAANDSGDDVSGVHTKRDDNSVTDSTDESHTDGHGVHHRIKGTVYKDHSTKVEEHAEHPDGSTSHRTTETDSKGTVITKTHGHMIDKDGRHTETSSEKHKHKDGSISKDEQREKYGDGSTRTWSTTHNKDDGSRATTHKHTNKDGKTLNHTETTYDKHGNKVVKNLSGGLHRSNAKKGHKNGRHGTKPTRRHGQ